MVKVIEESDYTAFETKCNTLLEEGYKVIAASCGFVNSEKYDFCNAYQAILVKQ